MNVELITPATLEAVSLEELKLHLRIELDAPDEDEYLEGLVKSAREYVEDVTRRQLLTSTWDYYLDKWPTENFISLPFGNLQTVTHVKYKKSDWVSPAAEESLTVTTDYLVETNSDQFGRIVLAYNESWPTDTLYPSKPIVIRFVCGWTTAALIPYEIKAAIKMIAAKLYESRGEDVLGQTVSENKTVDSLLWSKRLWGNF